MTRLLPSSSHRETSRRRFLRSAAAAATLVALPARLRAQASVKVGTAVLGDYALAGPFIVAVEKGFFQTEGLAAEFVPFRGGPDLVKAVIAGEILLGAAGSTDILVFREAGMPLKMIATQTEGNHFTLNVAPDVAGVGDLKGKAIGVTRVGATTWVFARMVARENGWDPDRDVKIVGDGGAVTEQQGKSKVLMRLDRVTPSWISQIQYASEDGIRKSGDQLRKVMKAVFRGQKLMHEKPDDAAGDISKRLGWTPAATLAAHKISGPLLSADGTFS